MLKCDSTKFLFPQTNACSHNDNGATNICRNVMEDLVAEEIRQQLHSLPPQLRQYIKQVQVMTYALNYLPPLYASSQRGWYYQMDRGKRYLGKEIREAVRLAIAAVQRDPIRAEVPLKLQEPEAYLTAVKKLQELLQQEELCWSNLPDIVEQALVKAAQGEITWKPKRHLPPLGYSWKEQAWIKTQEKARSNSEY
jgi:Late competence development protein ComFB